MKLGRTPGLPGLVGVRSMRQCARCGRYREGEGWRVELGHRVEWRRSRVEGAVPICGACLVVALVGLLRAGHAWWSAGPGGLWRRRLGRSGVVVESMGPRAVARAYAIGRAAGVAGLDVVRVDGGADQVSESKSRAEGGDA